MTENAERETERKGFTFFRSYYDAAEDMTDEEMLSYLKAIIHYSLFGEEPEELPRLVKAVFAAIKPNLDGNAKQFKNGCSGGRPRKAKNETGFENEKPNSEWVSEEENRGFTNEKPYKDKDKDKDMDMDNNPPIPPKGSDKPQNTNDENFERFWKAYPNKVSKPDARKAFGKVKVSVDVLIAAIEKQKTWDKWTDKDGKFIPNPSTWLNQEQWENEPPQIGNRKTITTEQRVRLPGETL